MGSLNSLFRSPEETAKRAKEDEDLILKTWKDYTKTIEEKEYIINKLLFIFGERKQNLKRLGELLDLELVDIGLIEKDDKDIISDLKSLEHNQRIAKIHRLENTLAYAESKYKYIFELLKNLYHTLQIEKELQIRLVSVQDLRKYKQLIEPIKSELAVELTILEKINERETFPKLFSDLINGEHIVFQLDKKGKRMVKFFADTKQEGLIDQWVMGVFDRIEDKVHEVVAEGTLDYHPHVNFEFVNHPEFTTLVREVIVSLRKKPVAEEMINNFVYMFREKYNSEVE